MGYWQPLLLSWLVTDDNQEVDAVKNSHDTSSELELLHWASSTQLEPNRVAEGEGGHL